MSRARGWGMGRVGASDCYGYGISVLGDENILNWIVVMLAQLCEYHLKITELLTLKKQKVWHVDYVSIKHFFLNTLSEVVSQSCPTHWWVNKIQLREQPTFGWISFPSPSPPLSLLVIFD